MREIRPNNEIIINAKGETRRVSAKERTIYHDKQTPIVDEARVLRHLQEARQLKKEMDTGQREATVEVPDNNGLPALIWLLCDSHLGSVEIDYEAFLNHYDLVLNTPGFYVVSNGDEVDNFMINLGGASTGVYEDPITPEQQARIMRKMWKKLDDNGKLLAMSYGNHNDWVNRSGYSFENTWLSDFKCPILNCGGLLNIRFGDQEYSMAVSHQYWGTSKLNPTNANKRMMEHEYPDADIVFLGHCFDSETEVLTQDGWKKNDEILKTDMVGTMRLDNGCFEWNEIRGKYEYNNYKKLHHYKGRGLDICVTDKHTMVYTNVSGGHKKNTYQDYKKNKNKRWKRETSEKLFGRSAPVYLPLSALNKNNDYPIDDNWIRLIGWLVSEGHFRKNGSTQLFQNVGEKEKEIKEILENLKIKYSCCRRKLKGRKFNDPRNKKEYTTKKDNIAFYITIEESKPIRKYINEKLLPEIVYSFSTRQFKILLDALCKGDGTNQIDKTHKGNTWVYYSKNKLLIDQIQQICVMNGYRSSIKSRNNCFEIVICNRQVAIIQNQSQKEIINYNGIVWCLSVDNETLVVRRNGKTAITGNTHQKECLQFERGGKRRTAVIGGTYKVDDEWSMKKGLTQRGQLGGATLALYPDRKQVLPFYYVEEAMDFLVTKKKIAEAIEANRSGY